MRRKHFLMAAPQQVRLATPKSSAVLASALALAIALPLASLPAQADNSAAPATTPATATLPQAMPASSATLPPLTQLIKQNRDAVVHISVEGDAGANNPIPGWDLDGMPEEMQKFFRNLPKQMPRGRSTNSMGSGFIISPDGYIVTNTHVIDGAKTITVTLNDKRELTAKLIGKDSESDIALLKVEASNLPVAEFGNSDGLEVGQWVFAIGAPFGLDHSATQGIVSALSRSLPDGTYVPFIQTDVAVNPGNSGGPLFDLNGKVVGVNSQIYSRSGGYMGISFAIPSNLVKNITEQLKTSGQVSRGRLGVGIQDLDQSLANSFGMQKPTGALVASVEPSSAADKAGVQAGDIIIGFNNTEVTSASHLPLLVGSTPVGQQVPLKILRKGVEQTLSVTVDKFVSKDAPQSPVANAEDAAMTGALGLAVSPLSGEERSKASLGESGVRVEQVRAESPADKAGIEEGDVIITVNNQEVKSPEDLKTKVEQAPADKPLAVLILRNDQKRFVAISRS
ncbi:DegQ family serine endoprotease [Thiolinea disciformis]|uniref:DegQ family serine endoprotease n=1 Tax=Thiolinea disciformis TaxID=125614 RepID=UPI000375F3FA|nr:DegQ family serine endoprotease [Thiolinea disciformis]